MLAESGEDLIVYSDGSDYAANMEMATTVSPQHEREKPGAKMEKVATPGQYSIEDVAKFLKTDIKKTLKTLVVESKEGGLVALVLRGDHELNPVKAEKLAQVAAPMQLGAPAEKIQKEIGCNTGSIGPINLKIPVIIDRDAVCLSDFVWWCE